MANNITAPSMLSLILLNSLAGPDTLRTAHIIIKTPYMSVNLATSPSNTEPNQFAPMPMSLPAYTPNCPISVMANTIHVSGINIII